MDTIQQIAISGKCKFNFPEFYLKTNLSDTEWEKLCSLPMWEITEEEIAIKKNDFEIDYVLYYKDNEFHYPIIFVNDGNLLTGGMGGVLPANLVSAFPGRLNISKQLDNLKELITSKGGEDYEGYITLKFFFDKHNTCFRSFDFGIQEDYLYNIQNLQPSDYFMHDLKDLKLPEPKGISISARIFGYPYTSEYNKEIADFLPALDLIELDDCFMITQYQEKINIKSSWESLYSNLSDPYFIHNGAVFNMDGEIKARKTFDALKKYRLIK